MPLVSKFEQWLEAAYCYYNYLDPLMEDVEWDMLGRELTETWDEWDHPNKNVVERGQMYTGFDIEYPEWVVEKYCEAE